MNIKVYNTLYDSFTLRETDAEPYFTSYLEMGITDKMKALANGSYLSDDPDIPLTDLAFTSYVLSNYAERYQKTEKGRFDIPKEITDRESENVLSRYSDIIEKLDKKIETMTVGTPGYNDYLTLRTCLGITLDTVSRTRAVEDVRSIRKFGEGVGLRMAELENFLADRETDDYLGYMESDDDPEKAEISRARNELRSYRNSLLEQMNLPDGQDTLDPATELLAIHEEIDKIDREFTPDFTARYAKYISGFSGASDFDGIAEKSIELQKTGNALSMQLWSLDDQTNRYFRNLGFEPDRVPPYTTVFTEYLEGRRDFSEAETPEGLKAIRHALEKYLDSQKSLSDEDIKHVVRFYQENAQTYRDMQKQYRRVLDDRNGLKKLLKRTELSCREDILIDRMGPKLEEAKRSDIRVTVDAPDATLRASLGKLEGSLKKTFKFGFNTTEYNAFRKALKSAAEGGDMSELIRTAEKYVNEKKRGGVPSTDSGKTRLSIAEQTILLARTGAAALAHPIEAQASAPLPALYSVLSNAASESLTEFRAAFTASYPDVPKKKMENTTEPKSVYEEPHPISATAEQKIHRKPENDTEASFLEIIDSSDDRYDLERQKDTKQYTYMESSSSSLNKAHEEFYPMYIARTLYTEYGLDTDKCTEIAEHMMRIIDNNLTGNFQQDVKFAYRQFRDELLLPKDGKPPAIPGYTTGDDHLSLAFGAMWSFIREYDLTVGAEMRWDRYGTPIDSRKRLEQKQLQHVEERYKSFTRRNYLKPDYAASIIDLARESNCTFNQRNFLLKVDVDLLVKAQEKVKDAEEFKKMFANVITGMEKGQHEKRINMYAESQKKLDDPDVAKL